MEIKTSQEVSQQLHVTTDGMTANKNWVGLDDEVKEAISLYQHIKNHIEVIEAPTYKGMPVCKICDKSAYQIMCEEWDKLSQEQDDTKDGK